MKKTRIAMALTLAATMLMSACSNTTNESIEAPANDVSAVTEATTQVLGETRETEVAASSASDTSAAASDDIIAFCQGHRTMCVGHDNEGNAAYWFEILEDGTFRYSLACGENDPVPMATGKFVNVEKVDDTTYRLELGAINEDHAVGEVWTEEIAVDGDVFSLDYVTVAPDKIAEHDVITVYLEGSNAADLPDEALNEYAACNDISYEQIPAQIEYTVIYDAMSGTAFA